LLQTEPAAFLQAHQAGRPGTHRRAQRREEGQELRARRRVRKQLEDAGIVLEDKPGGTTEWREEVGHDGWRRGLR